MNMFRILAIVFAILVLLFVNSANPKNAEPDFRLAIQNAEPPASQSDKPIYFDAPISVATYMR